MSLTDVPLCWDSSCIASVKWGVSPLCHMRCWTTSLPSWCKPVPSKLVWTALSVSPTGQAGAWCLQKKLSHTTRPGSALLAACRGRYSFVATPAAWRMHPAWGGPPVPDYAGLGAAGNRGGSGPLFSTNDLLNCLRTHRGGTHTRTPSCPPRIQFVSHLNVCILLFLSNAVLDHFFSPF